MGGCHPPCAAKQRELNRANRISRHGPEWSKPKRILITSDWHVPYHDPKAVEAVLQFVSENPIDILVLNGDIYDCYSLSKFDKNPDRIETFQDEMDKAHEIISEMVGYLPAGAKKVYIQGNHEDRLRKHLWKDGKPLAGVRALKFDRLTGLADLGFDCYEYGDVVGVGYDVVGTNVDGAKLHVTHGNIATKNAAKRMLEDNGVCIAFGHTHRLSTIHRTNLGGTIGAYELGCLADLHPEYIKGVPNWQHGVGIGMVFPNHHFSLQAVPIIKHKLMFDGQVYG